MLKKTLVILLSYFPLSTVAAEFEFSVGSGFQYSGIIGTQFAVKHQDSKYYLSLGLPGYSFGMQTVVLDNEHHSVGFSVGEIQGILEGDSQYGFITYNYHVSGFKNSGWVLGTGFGVYDEHSYKRISFTKPGEGKRINPSSKAMFTIDIGYKF